MKVAGVLWLLVGSCILLTDFTGMAGSQAMLVAVVVLVAVAVIGADAEEKTCTHNDQCDASSCCRLGSNRYSIPHCYPRRQENSVCSPTHESPLGPLTLNYPDGSTIHVEEAYLEMCPCEAGLACVEGTCQVEGSNSTP